MSQQGGHSVCGIRLGWNAETDTEPHPNVNFTQDSVEISLYPGNQTTPQTPAPALSSHATAILNAATERRKEAPTLGSHATTILNAAKERSGATFIDCQVSAIRTDWFTVKKSRLIGKGAFVTPYITGQPTGPPALTLTLVQGYGLFPPRSAEPCVLKRWPDGNLHVTNFFGLDEYLPREPLSNLSNDHFIAFLHEEAGLPSSAVLSLQQQCQ